MALWSRIVNVVRGERLSREIDDELSSPIEDRIEQSRSSAEDCRALGSSLRQRDASHDFRVGGWLDSLRADAVIGWRRLHKRKATSAAAILSLGSAIGACTAVFRLVDALFLRPLPVADPQLLYSLSRPGIGDGWEHKLVRPLRAALNNTGEKDKVELIAVSSAEETDLTYASDQQMEKAYIQYVSGWMFSSFGLQPARGHLLTKDDDLDPGAHPVAVLSYDYWTSRFGRDPTVIGRTASIARKYGIGSELFEIVGIAGKGFTGTEPGTSTEIFVPAMMHPLVNLPVAALFRTFVRLPPGVAPEPVRERLNAALHAINQEQSRQFPDRLNQTLLMEPAGTGVSGLQKNYGQALTALGILVGLVLVIACANVACLMTAQAAARAREMALRVAIGAGRERLLQLVLVESAILALAAAAVGAVLAWWAAPVVVARINPPANPASLALSPDWRVLGFGVALTFATTLLFGLAPALRASAVKPVIALKEENPRSRRSLIHVLVAIQVAFCFLVLFVAGMFGASFARLSHQPTGFASERLLAIETVTPRDEPSAVWQQVAELLRTVPGVKAAAVSEWPLLDGHGYRYNEVAIEGAPPTVIPVRFLIVSPGWIDTMKIPLIDGRDFRANETQVAIVNQAFARQYFPGRNPLGKTFEAKPGGSWGRRFRIAGVVGDTRYRSVRDPILPVAYVPFQVAWHVETFIVRTSISNPLALASSLRQEISRAKPGFRVSNIRTQEELLQAQTVRERLLATFALFFALVALLLAGIGLYGVLDYSVFLRRREIGIRMAIGAQASEIARLVTVEVFTMVLAGALVGVSFGMASARYIETLLYQVRPTDLGVLAFPSLTLLVAGRWLLFYR